jgi:hypothetical protein
MRHVLLTFALIGLVGCLDHGRTPCLAGDKADVAPAIQLRNPETGQCQTFQFPTCDQCGPCPGIGAAEPDWAPCAGPCSGLAEQACLAAGNCHAAYQDTGSATQAFMACFELPPSGVITGACTGADAQACSEHTDCFSVYTQTATPMFARCVAEIVPAACTTLTTEAACKARTDCDAVYTGTNCTCDHSGCTCTTETFKSCKAL